MAVEAKKLVTWDYGTGTLSEGIEGRRRQKVAIKSRHRIRYTGYSPMTRDSLFVIGSKSRK